MTKEPNFSTSEQHERWLLEEFRSLTLHGIHLDEKQAQAFFYGLVATSALLGFAASGHLALPSAVFLLPSLILIPVALIIVNLRLVSDRQAAYLRVRVPSAESKLSHLVSIRNFRWPGPGWYYPVYKLMVNTNLALILTCVTLALAVPVVTGRFPTQATLLLSSLVLLCTVGVFVYLAVTDHMCSPGRLEDAWRETLQKPDGELSVGPDVGL